MKKFLGWNVPIHLCIGPSCSCELTYFKMLADQVLVFTHLGMRRFIAVTLSVTASVTTMQNRRLPRPAKTEWIKNKREKLHKIEYNSLFVRARMCSEVDNACSRRVSWQRDCPVNSRTLVVIDSCTVYLVLIGSISIIVCTCFLYRCYNLVSILFSTYSV
jgi:hypothetical protein